MTEAQRFRAAYPLRAASGGGQASVERLGVAQGDDRPGNWDLLRGVYVVHHVLTPILRATSSATASGKRCPIFSRFVCRYARFEGFGEIFSGTRSTTSTPCRSRPSIFAGLLVSRRARRTPRSSSISAATR